MIAALSVSLYRLMMRAYPADFRRHYGSAVDQAFRDNVRDAVERRGAPGLALLWFNVIPDFLFSSAELLLSKAGDFLKWRFRLQWVLACSLGFGLSRAVYLMFGQEFYQELALRGAWWPVLGTMLLMAIRLASLGWMQSRVLADRCFRKKQWVLYGILGAALAVLAVQPLLWITVPALGRLPQYLQPTELTWVLNILTSAPMIILGAFIGALQSSAIKNDAVTRYRWVTACAAGYFLSAVLGGFRVPYPYSVFEVILTSVVAGAALGLLTCGPLERILFSVQLDGEER
jgi:hypothetical protein